MDLCLDIYYSCKTETFSTLRFAQHAKSIKNKAVVNEVMREDVKFLREVIRQLKVYDPCCSCQLVFLAAVTNLLENLTFL